VPVSIATMTRQYWSLSVQSAVRRLDRLPNLDFVVADEGHHRVSPSWAQVLAGWPEAKILGATARPERLDGKGLGVTSGGIFDSLVMGATVAELQGLGFLDFLEGRWLWALARYLDQVEPDADFLPAASRALYTLPRPIFSAVAMSVTERPALKSFTASSALSRADGLRPM
jgi:hypothetical protein